jgi:hypothetical protein
MIESTKFGVASVLNMMLLYTYSSTYEEKRDPLFNQDRKITPN